MILIATRLLRRHSFKACIILIVFGIVYNSWLLVSNDQQLGEIQLLHRYERKDGNAPPEALRWKIYERVGESGNEGEGSKLFDNNSGTNTRTAGKKKAGGQVAADKEERKMGSSSTAEETDYTKVKEGIIFKEQIEHKDTRVLDVSKESGSETDKNGEAHPLKQGMEELGEDEKGTDDGEDENFHVLFGDEDSSTSERDEKGEKDREGGEDHEMTGSGGAFSSSSSRGSEGTFSPVIIVLTQEKRYSRLKITIEQFEKTFNSKFNYPYVFLNDVAFSEKYKSRVKKLTNGSVQFVHIKGDAWNIPSHIDMNRVERGKRHMYLLNPGTPYWNSTTYRQMCRFQSGPLYMLKELEPYNWFWRLDDDVHYFCNLDYDPIDYLRQRGMVYGFSITIKEVMSTVTSFYSVARNFFAFKGLKYVTDAPWFGFFEQKAKQQHTTPRFNGCHFWTNMEIGSLDFFRGEGYQSYFRHLDNSGGFFYERWGDAPVRSVGLGYLARIDQIHLFSDIGYYHGGMFVCDRSRPNCKCKWRKEFGYEISNVKADECMVDFKEYKPGTTQREDLQFFARVKIQSQGEIKIMGK
eukprot:Nk52_evm46s224 gene=Nk52_evmTU46s224